MLRLRLNKRGQSTLEYAILIGVIVGALILMQNYLKRGYQGKLRESADSMGEQFSPELSTYNYTTNSFSNTTETLNTDQATVTDIHEQTTNRFGNETVQNLENETWW